MDSSVIQACIFFIFMYYILIIILYVCCSKIFCRREPETSDSIQLENVRNLTRINSDLQHCLMLEQSNQQSNTAHNFRINVPTTQSTIVPLSSELNYLEFNTSDVTSYSRPLMDDPPPPYDNVRDLTRINSDLQRCLVPINVLNSIGYERITYDPPPSYDESTMSSSSSYY